MIFIKKVLQGIFIIWQWLNSENVMFTKKIIIIDRWRIFFHTVTRKVIEWSCVQVAGNQMAFLRNQQQKN